MRFLFLANRAAGCLAPFAKWLAANPENEVYFGMCAFRHGEDLPGVRKIHLRGPDKAPKPQNVLERWKDVLMMGKRALASLNLLKENGLVPDIIVNTSVNGISLGLPMLFPQSFTVHLAEHLPGANRATRSFQNLVQGVMLEQADLAYACSRRLAKTLRTNIKIAPMVIDDKFFSLEHLPAESRDNAQADGVNESGAMKHDGKKLVVCLCNVPQTACSAWIELAETLNMPVTLLLPNRSLVSETLDKKNITAMLKPGPAEFRAIMASARLFVCPVQEQEKPRELLEAMSCGVCSLTNLKSSFLVDGQNSLRLPLKKVRENVLAAWENPDLEKIGRRGAKEAAEKFGMENVLPEFFAEILNAREEWLTDKS